MENQFRRVVQWVDDSTNLLSYIQLFEDYYEVSSCKKAVKNKFTIRTGIRRIPHPSKDNQDRKPGYLLFTYLQYVRTRILVPSCITYLLCEMYQKVYSPKVLYLIEVFYYLNYMHTEIRWVSN